MGLISRLLAPTAQRNINRPDVVMALRGESSFVSPESATQIATVFACQRIIAESLAMLPLMVYRKGANGSRSPAIELPLLRMLGLRSNPEMTAFDVRSSVMGHVVRRGNGFAQIVRNGAGQVIELWPLIAGYVRVGRRENGDLIYVYYRPNGTRRVFERWEIFHMRGLSGDGLIGYSPISEARLAFQQAKVMDEYGLAFYENGGRPGGVLENPGLLDDEAYGRIEASWEKAHSGPGNVGKLAILEQGTKYTPINVAQTDQQFLEQKKLTRQEIASIFRVPSHMVNDLDRATFSSVEEMSQEFIDYTLGPWLVQWEQSIARDLLAEDELDRYYAKHTVQALLRGNNASRAEYYAKGLQWGWTTINEVRAHEEQNPIANGDETFVPLNMVPLGQAVKGAGVVSQGQPAARTIEGGVCSCGQRHQVTSEMRAAEGEDPSENLRLGRVEMASSMQAAFEDAAKRMVKREVRDVGKAVEKFLKQRSSEEFVRWLEEFYRNGEFTPAVREAFKPLLLTLARQAMLAASAELGKKSPGLVDSLREFVDTYVKAFADNWSASSRQQLIALLEVLQEAENPAEAVSARLAEWDEGKAAKTGLQQAFEATNALIIASYVHHGVERLRWLASGKSCPFCQSLNGKTAGIREHFVSAGSEIDGGAELGTMSVKRDTRHGPLHRGCDCVVVAA